MTYEEIWQKIRRMSQHNRKHLAYEMTLVGLNVIHITTLMLRQYMTYCSIHQTVSMKLRTKMELITMR